MADTSGLYIGANAPEDTTLIWFDTTPSQKCHKVYDFFLLNWIVLKQEIISVIQYSELVNLASGDGLSLGAHYRITDKLNAIAVAITTTKVQYTDALGNIVVDDLGTNIQYHVTSSNLLIDDLAGVFDLTNKKLIFTFDEVDFDFTDGYIFGKSKVEGIFSLAKYKLSKLISEGQGNLISWNNGLYFNFKWALDSWKDKAGGFVSKEKYDTDMDLVSRDTTAIGSNYQSIVAKTAEEINNQTSSNEIYSKTVPSLVATGEATDILLNDSLLIIVSKFQRWINKFKEATGIKLSLDFSPSSSVSAINNNDSVDSAFRKTQAQINNTNAFVSNFSKTYRKQLSGDKSTWLAQNLAVGESVEVYYADFSYAWSSVRDVMNIWASQADFISSKRPIIQIIFKAGQYPLWLRITKVSSTVWAAEVHKSDSASIWRYFATTYAANQILKLDVVALTLISDDTLVVSGSTKIQNLITLNVLFVKYDQTDGPFRDQIHIKATSSEAVGSALVSNIIGYARTTGPDVTVDHNITIPIGGVESETYIIDDVYNPANQQENAVAGVDYSVSINSLAPTSDLTEDYSIDSTVVYK